MKKSLILITFIISLLYCDIGLCRNINAIQKIEDYFYKIETMSANLTQIGPEKGMKKIGKIEIKKPNKLKIEYYSPTKITMISNNGAITYYDHDMEELSKIKNKNLFIELLTKKNTSIKELCDIVSLVEQNNEIELVLTNKKSKTYPYLIIKFHNHPSIHLKNIYILDDEVTISEIILSNIIINQKIPEENFTFKNPKFFQLKDS